MLFQFLTYAQQLKFKIDFLVYPFYRMLIFRSTIFKIKLYENKNFEILFFISLTTFRIKY